MALGIIVRLVLLLTVAHFASLVAVAEEQPGDATEAADRVLPPALLTDLRSGGHIIYFRHAATDHDTVDTDRQNLDNCATQRNLSELGRQQSAQIGAAFRRLGLPVGTVLSSPYCRCIDTVKLAFGQVTVSDDLVFALDRGEAETQRLATALKQMLAAQPTDATNTVIAGHTVNLREATGIWPKPEGAAVIFKPDGAGTFFYLATVHPEAWGKTAAGSP